LARAHIRGPVPHGGAVVLRPVVERVARAFARMPGGEHLAWQVDVPADLAVPIEEDDLVELLGVLFDNAAKWARATVRVGALPEAGGLRIHVEDDGPGIAPQDRRAALTRGTRLDPDRSGTGLGLAISREFCRLLGGELSVRSDLGAGSVFTVSIPVRLAKGERAVNDGEGVEISVDPAAAQRTRVLVVDDNRFSLQYMDRFLAAQGFWLKLAEDGEEAVDSAVGRAARGASVAVRVGIGHCGGSRFTI
jgi:CheY-like chemotaxis protein